MSNLNSIKKRGKIIKGIFTLIFLTVCSILFAEGVDAIPSWNGSATSGMPSFQVDGETGYFPQSASGAIIFCNDETSGVRSGSKDYKIYYPTVADYNTVMAYESSSDPKIFEDFDHVADNRIENEYYNIQNSLGSSSKLIRDTRAREYPTSISITWAVNTTIGEYQYVNESKPLLLFVSNDSDVVTLAGNISKKMLSDIFYELSGEEKPQDLQPGYDLTEEEYPFEIEDRRTNLGTTSCSNGKWG